MTSNTKFTVKRSLSESSVEDFISRPKAKELNKSYIKNINRAKTKPKDQILKNRFISNAIEIAIRITLVILFIVLENFPPFIRKIQPEELWMYKYPRTADYVSPEVLLLTVVLGPLLVTLLYFLRTGDRNDFCSASWTWTLILGLNGLFTSILKIVVGRPRPDFFYRCFPDGVMVLKTLTSDEQIENGRNNELNCTGNHHDINEGRKSFPSGHSSFAFASYGFLAFYAAGKLQTFNTRRQSQSWRLCISALPLTLALLVAVSRTCDYHHHWQDVVAGSIIGLLTSYTIYRQYYPSIFQYSECTHSQKQTKKKRLFYENGTEQAFYDNLLNEDDHNPLIS